MKFGISSRTLWLSSSAIAVVVVGCGVEDDLQVSAEQFGAVVSDYHTTSCSTSVVLGLSEQIAEQVQCLAPEALASFSEGGGIVFNGSAVLPWVSLAGREDLLAAVDAHGGELLINSGFRSVAQQYLLYQWYLLGRCGIPAAATPGRSNHESGRALDIGNHGEWSSILPMYGWVQTVPGDDVHFDHLDSPDNRGYDVLAFQQLWNLNNPDDAIAEDGDYGSQTEARLAASPAEGFPVAGCDPGDPGDPPGPPEADLLTPTVRDNYANAPDEPDVHGDPADAAGGCSVGGSAGGGLASLLLLALLGRAVCPSTFGRRAGSRSR